MLQNKIRRIYKMKIGYQLNLIFYFFYFPPNPIFELNYIDNVNLIKQNIMTRIEHVNITVPDIDAAISFLKVVAPDFEVRKDSQPSDSYRWVHIGNDEYYIALQEAHLDATPQKRLQPYRNYGINHLAIIVSNIEEIEANLIDGGYQRGIEAPIEKYRKRLYYFDKGGLEWELIEYLSDEINEKFLYE